MLTIEESSIQNKNIYQIAYPISYVLLYDSLSNKHLKYTLAITSNNEPKNYVEASRKQEWEDAMNKEIKALQDNKTWYLTNLPSGKTPIGSKWVYRIKYKSDCTIERYNARLVAKEYNQLEGINFLGTFPPMAKLT